MLAEVEMEAEALDTVDPGIVAEYREAQEVNTILGFVFEIVDLVQIVREVERDILRREQQQREEQALIDEVTICNKQNPKSFTIVNPSLTQPLQVKTAWLADLEELIERISAKFSAHFASMGFAGQVDVKRFVSSDRSSLQPCPRPTI